MECSKNKDWSVRENVALCIQTLADKLKPIQDKEIQKVHCVFSDNCITV